MCAFFAAQIFDHPRLQNVTYYMRLDTDSYIVEPLCYDPIALMHERNRTYGYRSRMMDPHWATAGMWDLVDDYVRARPSVELNLARNGWRWPADRERVKMSLEEFPIYFNNFEIVKLDAFRRPEVREWLDEILRVPERVYKYRWGAFLVVCKWCRRSADISFVPYAKVMRRSVTPRSTCSSMLIAT